MDTQGQVYFTVPQRILHWATALLVFYNLLLPDGMEQWNRAMHRVGSATPEQVASANIHAYAGIAIVVLAVLRLILRAVTRVPDAPPQEPPIFRLAAKLTHTALYILLIALPLTGIGAYYFGNGVAGDIHADILKVILWVLIAAHVGGVLVHQFYWKTDVLRRMTVG